jgi:hypothetical protein
MLTKKQYVEYLISTPKKCTCTYLAEHWEDVSHDGITAFLHPKRFLPREVWQLGKDRIADSKDACRIVADSVQDKRYSRSIALGRAQSSGNAPGGVRGIGVVSLVHSGGKDNESGITQELKSAIKCWCYEQHQHCNNPCNGNVSHWLTVSQHADELGEFSVSLRPSFARYLAPGPLSEGSLVSTALGILCPGARTEGWLSRDR